MSCIRILSEEDVRAAIDTDRALELARLTLRDHPAIKLSAPTIMSVAMGKTKVI